jgi:hypothetical protein
LIVIIRGVGVGRTFIGAIESFVVLVDRGSKLTVNQS